MWPYSHFMALPPRAEPSLVVHETHDPCGTPQFWQMIRDRADKLPEHSEWRMPNLSDAWAVAFH